MFVEKNCKTCQLPTCLEICFEEEEILSRDTVGKEHVHNSFYPATAFLFQVLIPPGDVPLLCGICYHTN